MGLMCCSATSECACCLRSESNIKQMSGEMLTNLNCMAGSRQPLHTLGMQSLANKCLTNFGYHNFHARNEVLFSGLRNIQNVSRQGNKLASFSTCSLLRSLTVELEVVIITAQSNQQRLLTVSNHTTDFCCAITSQSTSLA